MAKVLMERRLEELRLGDLISVDSAGTFCNPLVRATNRARFAIQHACGMDLLADHHPKDISDIRLNDFDLILTMEERQKIGLPISKTFTIKEYAGARGDVADPEGLPQEGYDACCGELMALIDRVIEKIAITL